MEHAAMNNRALRRISNRGAAFHSLKIEGRAAEQAARPTLKKRR